ncbi:ANR24 protein, partial [Psilopogon haemacephalus]|nr:ANR24 protein [Psilopogon haemacephalus]
QHEAAQEGLRAEASRLERQLAELSRRHEKTCEEVFRLSSSPGAEGEGWELCPWPATGSTWVLQWARPWGGLGEMRLRGPLCAPCAAQITELSKEVFRLKEALNALPESRGPTQSAPDSAALQARIRTLEEKLEETEKRHSKVVTLYRSHLLYAVQ